MSKDVQPYETMGLLAELSDDPDDAFAGVVSLPDRVSRAGNCFTLINAEESFELSDPHKLNFVIIKTKEPPSRAYYNTRYQADNTGPPTCKSYDSLVPDVDAPQSPTCPTCQWAQRNISSPISGKSVSACQQRRDLAIKVMGEPGLWWFDIPPGSWKAYANIAKQIRTVVDNSRKSDSQRLGMSGCVIQAEFAKGRMGILEFKLAGYASESERLEIIKLKQDSAAIDEMLWGSPERRVRWEKAAGKTPESPPGVLSPPDRSPPPEPPKNPPTPPPAPSNEPLSSDAPVRRSRRTDPRPGAVETNAAFDALFNENFAEKPDA